jgi:Mg-chelatase subunit ChlD
VQLPARFCCGCGKTLEGTVTLNRTVIYPAGPPPIAAFNYEPGSRSVGSLNINDRTLLQRTAAAESMDGQREDVVQGVDVSGSMGERYDDRHSKIAAAIRAAASLVLQKSRVDPNDRVGVVAFHGKAYSVAALAPVGTQKQQLIQAIMSLRDGGNTDINAGLKVARDIFDWTQSDVVRRIVLLTDGHGGDPLHTAEELKARGVVIDVIGVGENPAGVDEKLLKKVASFVEGKLRYRFIKDEQTLVDYYTQLANKTALGE